MGMSLFAIVLFAAALHAGWNAIVKGGGDTLLTTVLVTASAALLAIAALPFLPAPAPASWPFIAASTLLQIGYYLLVARTYRLADMSLAYPLMRGSAPLLVAVMSAVWIGEPLVLGQWFGIAVLCAGILSMAGSARRDMNGGSALLPLANAVVIAGYTLIDGLGVRRSAAPAAYTLWIFLLTGAVLTVWILVKRGAEFRGYVRRNWRLGLVGGVGTVGSYGIALWAMIIAPVAVVAALRETSILFGTAISAFILHERVGRVRVIAVCIIALGAILLRLA